MCPRRCHAHQGLAVVTDPVISTRHSGHLDDCILSMYSCTHARWNQCLEAWRESETRISVGRHGTIRRGSAALGPHLHGSTLAIFFCVSGSKQMLPARRRVRSLSVRSGLSISWRDTRVQSRRTDFVAIHVVVYADDSPLAPHVRERIQDQIDAPRRAVLPAHVPATTHGRSEARPSLALRGSRVGMVGARI